MDGGFLEQLELGHMKTELAAFWPRSGPRWDGLAILRTVGAQSPAGYLLIEGKSYPGEVYGSGCKATPDSPQAKLIEKSLGASKRTLGVRDTAMWMGRLYQYANRLAHVCFLHEHTGLPVWLVNLCFTGDPRSPYSEEDWRESLAKIKHELGCDSPEVPRSIDVFLSARGRSELLSPTLPTA
jgi:hypothetical protein